MFSLSLLNILFVSIQIQESFFDKVCLNTKTSNGIQLWIGMYRGNLHDFLMIWIWLNKPSKHYITTCTNPPPSRLLRKIFFVCSFTLSRKASLLPLLLMRFSCIFCSIHFSWQPEKEELAELGFLLAERKAFNQPSIHWRYHHPKS